MLYVKIASAIRDYISTSLFPGARLPSIRELSKRFQVSKNTISAALEHLNSEGLVEIKPQSGVVVSTSAWTVLFAKTPQWDEYTQGRRFSPSHAALGKLLLKDVSQVQMHRPYIDSSIADFSYIERTLKEIRVGRTYRTHSGLPLLKKELCEHFAEKGIKCSPDEILITSGTNQSLHLLSLVMFGPNVSLVSTNPTNLELLSSIESSRVKQVEVPSDREGIIVDSLIRKTNNLLSKILYIDTTCNWPTGRATTDTRKRDLFNTCSAMRTLIIEKDELSDIMPNKTKSIKSLDKSQSVIYLFDVNYYMNMVGIGCIVAHRRIIDILSDVLAQIDAPHSLNQHILCEMLKTGLYREYTEKIRLALDERITFTNMLLKKHLGNMASWEDTNPALMCWLEFKIGMVKKIYNDSLRGFTFVPGSLLDMRDNKHMLIMPAGLAPDELEKGIISLAKTASKYLN